jgi:CelD/BcsL family acetyltransferase involved in cellulose biosynthesis
MRREWEARVVRPRELSADEIQAWTSFCATDPTLAHPFYAFAFARAADRVHPYVFVAVIRRRGEVAGFLPFQFDGPVARILGKAERIGGFLSDRFGVIAAEDLGLEPPRLLRLARLNSFSYSFLPAEQLRHGFPGQRVVTGLRVALSGDRESFWNGIKAESRKFVSQVERNERLLTQQIGPLRMEFRADPGVELPRLISVKGAQYLRTGAQNLLSAHWTTELFQELLRSPDPQCTAMLSTLYAGDQWLASHLGVMSDSVFHYWFPVYNPDHARFSPGNILAKHLVLTAVAEGKRYFDMAGYGQYKTHFRPESYEYHAGLWRSNGVGGLVNQVALSLEWRLQRFMSARRESHLRLPEQSEGLGLESK